MNAPSAPVRFDPDDLLAMPDGDRYELVGGRLKELPMGAEADEITGIVTRLLGNHVYPNGLGRVYVSTGFVCFPDDPKKVRKPDAAFVARGRLTDNRSPLGFFALAPDLAVEVVSPNDTYEEVEEKLTDYRAAEVRLVWVVSPGSKTVQIRRADGTCAVLRESDQLSGEGVVPGFECNVADLFV